MYSRSIAILLVALAMMGCAQTNHTNAVTTDSAISTAKTNCSLYRGTYGPRDYVLLRIKAKDAVRDSGLSLYSSAADFTGPEKRRKVEEDVRNAADRAIKKLDEAERQVEAGKISMGECFGKGEYGSTVAEQYALTMEEIAKQRNAVTEEVEEILAKSRDMAEEEADFERWREKNKKLLVRRVGGMRLEIVRISTSDIWVRPGTSTVITFEATNTTTSRIFKPRNQKIWGYEYGSNVGGRLPIGAFLRDSFGNDYKLTSVSPGFLGNEAAGIKPGQTVSFKVTFGDVPLQNADTILLGIASTTFGQEGEAVFEIPSEALHGPLARR